MASNVYGVDIGTSNIKLYNKDKQEILNEKNIIAISNKKDVFAFGDDAFEMEGKAPENIKVSCPVKDGVVADVDNMCELFKLFYKKSNKGKKSSGDDFYVAVPTDITDVEKRAFYELIIDAKIKAKNIYIIDKPVADAIGAGINVTSAQGVMVVDIGSDTTEISVLSLGGIVISKSVKIAGKKFDDNIIMTVKKKYNLIIGNKTAEVLKKNLAYAIDCEDKTFPVYGRDVVSGLPVQVHVSSKDIYECMYEPIHSIIDSIKVILERTPPELAADIIDTGVYLSGGSSMIRNLDKLISEETGLKVINVETPSETVIRGVKEVINNPKAYVGIAKIPREKNYI